MINIGKTDHYAWGATCSYIENVDIYREEILPDGLTRKTDDPKAGKLTVIEEKIEIKGEPSYNLKVYKAKHGLLDCPILSRVKIGEQFLPLSEKLSLCWQGMRNEDYSMDYKFDILFNMTNRSALEMKNIAEKITLDAELLTVADDQGNIILFNIGSVPKRNFSSDNWGYILDGTKKENDWEGFIPPEDILYIMNPRKGFVAHANNKLAPSKFMKHHISRLTQPTSRYSRIQYLISNAIKDTDKINSTFSMKLQQDNFDHYANLVLSRIIHIGSRCLKFKGLDKDPVNEFMLDQLNFWSRISDAKSIGATIYYVNLMKISLKLLAKVSNHEHRTLIALYSNFDNFVFWQLEKLAKDLDENYEDACSTQLFKSKLSGDDVVQAFLEAKNWILEHFGPDPQSWKWGNLHTTQLEHQFYSNTPFHIYSNTKLSASGFKYTPNAQAAVPSSDPDMFFQANHNPGFRMIANFGENSKSYYITDTGINENFFSPHYLDQLSLYAQGKYIEMKSGKENLKDLPYVLTFK